MILRMNSSTSSAARTKLYYEYIIIYVIITAAACISTISAQEPQDGLEGAALPQEFSPTVTATCRGTAMTILVTTTAPFYGIVHPRIPRRPNDPCAAFGDGSRVTTLILNTLADASDPDYCGVNFSERTEERSVQIAVRAHRTLELAEDKVYVVTCGKAGFKSPIGNDKYSVRLGFYNNEKSTRSITEVVYGRAYQLRVELGNAEANMAIRVRSCFSFGSNSSVPLVDDSGCPEKGVISRWKYSSNNQLAEATIYSMFRFADSKRMNFQCDVLICQDSSCPNPRCESVPASLIANPTPQRQRSSTESSVLASTTVTVLQPGDKPVVENLTDEDIECTGLCRYWNLLFWLAIIFGIMCLVMFLVSCFLCSALTCTCTRTELVEKEPSVLEDYDPYRSSWAGSNYGGSRYSLTNGGHGQVTSHHKPIYSVSAESNGGGSDHYATVPSRQSRPGSRYSNAQNGGAQNGIVRLQGPSSNGDSPNYPHRKL